MGWDPYIVRRELRELDRRVVPGFKSSVLVEFKDLSFHVHAPGNLTDDEVDEVCCKVKLCQCPDLVDFL